MKKATVESICYRWMCTLSVIYYSVTSLFEIANVNAVEWGMA